MVSRRSLSRTLLLAVILCSPFIASAHGEGGLTFTSTTSKGWIVDVDYGEPVIEAGRLGRFSLALYADAERTREISFTDVSVRVIQLGQKGYEETLFAGVIAKSLLGGRGFSYAFPDGGQYLLGLRFTNSSVDSIGETLAEVVLPFTVEDNLLSAREANRFTFSKEFWAGILGGIFIGAAALQIAVATRIRRRRSHNSHA